MNKLSERTRTLILMGASQTGTFLDSYFFIEESLYMNEATEIQEFCEWIDKNVGGAGLGNIDKLFNAFKHPNDKELQLYVEEMKKIIQSYKII